MTFTVDERKKRAWGRGWLRDWTQGKVLVALSLIGVVSFLVMLPHHVRCYSELFTIDSIPMGAERNEAFVRDAVDVVVVGFQIGLAACGPPALSRRDAPARAFSNESLSVEGGLLRWSRASDYEGGEGPCLLVTLCRVDSCSFAYDARSRMLVVSAGGEGSMGWGLCDGPGAALAVTMGELEPAGEWPWPDRAELYPYFSPDPIQYLRGLGVEVEGA